MKKHFLVLSMSLCMAMSYAQTLIPKIGGTLSNIAFDKDIYGDASLKSKAGLLLGVGIEFPLNDLVSLQPELLFQQKGSTLKFTNGNATYESKLTLNYLELPVLVKLNFGKFYVNAGPSVSYGIGGKTHDKYTAAGISEKSTGKVKFGKEPDDNEDDTYFDNALDLGLQVGGGFKIAKFLIIDVRYGLGLSNLYDKDEDAGFTKNKSKNRSLQVTLGFPISLGGK